MKDQKPVTSVIPGKDKQLFKLACMSQKVQERNVIHAFVSLFNDYDADMCSKSDKITMRKIIRSAQELREKKINE